MFKAFEILKIHDCIAKKLGVIVPDGSGFWYVLKAIGFNGKYIIPGKPQKSLDDLKKLAIRFIDFLPNHLKSEYSFDPNELDLLKTEIANLKEELAQQENKKSNEIRIVKIALFVSMTSVGLQASGLGFDIYKSIDNKPNQLKELQLNAIQYVKNHLLEKITVEAVYISSKLSHNEYWIHVTIANDSCYDLKIISIDHCVHNLGIVRHINTFKIDNYHHNTIKAKATSSFSEGFTNERPVTMLFRKGPIRDWIEENEQFISTALTPTVPEELFAATGSFSYKQLLSDHQEEVPLKLEKVFKIGKISDLPDGDG